MCSMFRALIRRVTFPQETTNAFGFMIVLVLHSNH